MKTEEEIIEDIIDRVQGAYYYGKIGVAAGIKTHMMNGDINPHEKLRNKIKKMICYSKNIFFNKLFSIEKIEEITLLDNVKILFDGESEDIYIAFPLQFGIHNTEEWLEFTKHNDEAAYEIPLFSTRKKLRKVSLDK